MYQMHDIAEIEGIGSGRAKALAAVGLAATEDLVELPEQYLIGRLHKIPGFPEKKARELRRQAMLMQVSGLTGQHAEVIFFAGHRDLRMFAAAATKTIVAEMKQAVAAGTIPSAPDIETVAAWQKRAVLIAYTRKVSGRVFSGETPITGATVYCQNETAITDSAGRFWLPAVPYEASSLVIRADGYQRFSKRLDADGSKDVISFSVSLLPGTVESETIDEAAGQSITSFAADDSVELVDVDPKLVAVDTPFILRERYKNGRVRLIGVYRRKVGNKVETTRIVAPGTVLASAATKVNDIVRWNGKQMSRTTESVSDIRLALLTKDLDDSQNKIVRSEDSQKTVIIKWVYFDGSTGCDFCKCMTGYYVEPFERPHPNCDCVISPKEIEATNVYGETCEIKSIHPTGTETSLDEEIVARTPFNNYNVPIEYHRDAISGSFSGYSEENPGDFENPNGISIPDFGTEYEFLDDETDIQLEPCEREEYRVNRKYTKYEIKVLCSIVVDGMYGRVNIPMQEHSFAAAVASGASLDIMSDWADDCNEVPGTDQVKSKRAKSKIDPARKKSRRTSA